MFSTLGLFRQLSCTAPACSRINCPFSHVPVNPLPLPADGLKSLAAAVSEQPRTPQPNIKRPGSPSLTPNRPLKLQKTEDVNKPASPAVASSSRSAPPNQSISRLANDAKEKDSALYGPPKITATPATSRIPLVTRQALLTSLYNAFKDLYHKFHQERPDLAHKDALIQEEEVYAKTNKLAYKNAMIVSISTIKKRPVPDSPSHLSVGTEGTRAEREAQRKVTPTFNLTLEDLEPLFLTEETLQLYGFPLDIPSSPGSGRPHDYGLETTCDRCNTVVIIKHDEGREACQFHWGRPIKSTGGEFRKMFACCSAPYPLSPGCQTGPHVFIEKEIEQLHLRHAFTPSSNMETDTALDIAAIDCEGIYTTQGMSVARVSVCDGEGKVVFDELIRPDEGVEVIDYNTRFSGVTSLKDAVFDLEGIRRALDAFIGPKTVIIGHSVENDLKMLRMIHRRIVDTVVLYPSPQGLPYRRALRILAREYLHRSIQTGGATEGHSSAEDALASLDLVKYYIKDRKERRRITSAQGDQ